MPLTAAEWLSENSERQELAVMNIPLAMEAYAKYRADMESVRFGQWIKSKYTIYNDVYWLSLFGAGFYTTTQLFDLFKTESNGK